MHPEIVEFYHKIGYVKIWCEGHHFVGYKEDGSSCILAWKNSNSYYFHFIPGCIHLMCSSEKEALKRIKLLAFI